MTDHSFNTGVFGVALKFQAAKIPTQDGDEDIGMFPSGLIQSNLAL